MARAPKVYTRLTRNAAGLGSYASLWLAADHLMLVRSTGYNESYSRLQLGDLKGIFLVATDRRLWWGIFWGIIAGWAAIALVITLVNRDAPIFSAIFLVLGATGFAWNHLLGPGCRAYVLTGVQTAELPSLVRQKKAQRVIARLQPLIASAQADLLPSPPPVPAAAPAASEGGAPAPAPAPEVAAAPVPPAPPEPPAG